MTTARRASRGFTLIELAIVMLITGLLLIGAARLFENLQLEQALKATRQRIEKIQKQLDTFADKNERFPCPLPPAGGPMTAEPGSCANADLPPDARDVARGILPAIALDLAPDEVRDGWGNMFTYAVSAKLTKEKGMHGVTPPAGVIGMVNGYGDNLLDTADSGRYAIISHGPSGAGGFTQKGTEVPCREGTLSAKNCHTQTSFVAAAWSTRPGLFFFDNIVVGDGSRRQARLLEHLDYCGRLGKYYAPERFFADKDGCVADDKVYGACTIETSYMQQGGMSPFTGDWDGPPQVGWAPAKAEPPAAACECKKDFSLMKTGTWELPLHHWEPPLTKKQSCKMGVEYLRGAIKGNFCDNDPPAVDVNETEWAYDYIAIMDGMVLKQVGSEWKPEDGRSWQILPVLTLDPVTGEVLHGKAAAHRNGTRVLHVEWNAPLVEKNHKLTLYNCTRN